MSLISRIFKKLARRTRKTGTLRKSVFRPGRSRMNDTAATLWQRKYRFRETPAVRAGTKRRYARERKTRRHISRKKGRYFS